MTSEPREAFVWVWLPAAEDPVVAGRLDVVGDVIARRTGIRELRGICNFLANTSAKFQLKAREKACGKTETARQVARSEVLLEVDNAARDAAVVFPRFGRQVRV